MKSYISRSMVVADRMFDVEPIFKFLDFVPIVMRSVPFSFMTIEPPKNLIRYLKQGFKNDPFSDKDTNNM